MEKGKRGAGQPLTDLQAQCHCTPVELMAAPIIGWVIGSALTVDA